MKSGAFSEISQRRHRRKGPVAAALYFYYGLLGAPREEPVEYGTIAFPWGFFQHRRDILG